MCTNSMHMHRYATQRRGSRWWSGAPALPKGSSYTLWIWHASSCGFWWNIPRLSPSSFPVNSHPAPYEPNENGPKSECACFVCRLQLGRKTKCQSETQQTRLCKQWTLKAKWLYPKNQVHAKVMQVKCRHGPFLRLRRGLSSAKLLLFAALSKLASGNTSTKLLTKFYKHIGRPNKEVMQFKVWTQFSFLHLAALRSLN